MMPQSNKDLEDTITCFNVLPVDAGVQRVLNLNN